MIFVAVLGAITAFVAAPLYKRGPAVAPPHRRALEARRDVLLSTLRELEIDKTTGALDDDEYARARAGAETEAAAVVRRLSLEAD